MDQNPLYTIFGGMNVNLPAILVTILVGYHGFDP